MCEIPSVLCIRNVHEISSVLYTENVQEIVPYTGIRKCQENLKISCHWEMYMKLEISWRFQGIRNSRLFPVYVFRARLTHLIPWKKANDNFFKIMCLVV